MVRGRHSTSLKLPHEEKRIAGNSNFSFSFSYSIKGSFMEGVEAGRHEK